MTEELSCLLAEFTRTTAGVVTALVVSADGLRLATSPGMDVTLADQLAAAASGMVSLARGTAVLLGAGPVDQTIVEMETGYLFVTTIDQGAALAVHAERTCDIGQVGYEMTMLGARVWHALTPQVRSVAGDAR